MQRLGARGVKKSLVCGASFPKGSFLVQGDVGIEGRIHSTDPL